jgi:dextranase
MKKMIANLINSLLTCLVFFGCKKNDTASNPGITNVTTIDTIVALVTNKAVYNPGDVITFSIDKPLPSSAKIRYRHLDQVVAESNVSGTSWTWTAPPADFTGYMVDLYKVENGVEKIYGSTAVDVSSDWNRFPRYGFLSSYGRFSKDHMDSVMNNLSRLHINGIQFYDWEYDHHQPLAGTVSNPAANWSDIANRINYKSTVDYYISSAHTHNMLAMSYNLCYGALKDAASDGVSDQWYLYTDQNHQSKYVLNLQAPFKSEIYLLDPSNTSWQQYIAGKTKDMYDVYAFDGYHVDQVGDIGNIYDYNGNSINLTTGFGSFLSAMKRDAPSKKLVMNAVNQFGQQAGISTSPVDFLYTEVWSPNEGYNDLSNILKNNYTWSNNAKKSVLAAYMDYNVAKNSGYFNTPGVLLTDAVIFAFGGAHLEMGDHMLCNEYFPNDNLQMKPDLKQSMVHYYDFLTAYENLLRDGGSFNTPDIISADGKTIINNWPPQNGSISVIGKDLGTSEVIHLINFANAATFDWRDTNGNQTTPKLFTNISFILTTSKPVKKLWMASPDIDGGVLHEISFTQSANADSFTLPSLQYWDMLVAEY